MGKFPHSKLKTRVVMSPSLFCVLTGECLVAAWRGIVSSSLLMVASLLMSLHLQFGTSGVTSQINPATTVMEAEQLWCLPLRVI